MKFLDNLLRYPRFFLSSMLGLFLILINPVISLFALKKYKVGVVLFIVLVSFLILYILKEMMNPTY
jgi:hypothetical protein